MNALRAAILATALAGLISCRPHAPEVVPQQYAESLVALELALDRLRPGEVDAYFGPNALQPRFTDVQSIGALAARARKLHADAARDLPEIDTPRACALLKRIDRFVVLLERIQSPRALSFDEEAMRVYDVQLDPAAEPDATRYLDEMDVLLPGPGGLHHRIEQFLARFTIPEARREAVFRRALAECRRRTALHWPLPEHEHLNIEWTSQIAAAWHRYDGSGRSTIRVNPRAVASPGAAIDVACHEGYPGHHAQFLMLDADPSHKQAADIENQLVLLRSPDSALLEGAASYGVDLAFDAPSRLAFLHDVLFPLAGLPTEDAAHYVRVDQLMHRLADTAMWTLRRYHDGQLSMQAALLELRMRSMLPRPLEALQFEGAQGASIAAYTVVREKIRTLVTQEAGEDGADPWRVLRELLVHRTIQPPTHRSCIDCACSLRFTTD